MSPGGLSVLAPLPEQWPGQRSDDSYPPFLPSPSSHLLGCWHVRLFSCWARSGVYVCVTERELRVRETETVTGRQTDKEGAPASEQRAYLPMLPTYLHPRHTSQPHQVSVFPSMKRSSYPRLPGLLHKVDGRPNNETP